MHSFFLAFFWALAALALLAALAFGAALAYAALRRRASPERRERALERALSVDRPWISVPEYSLPGAPEARRIAADRGYVLRGIERSRGLLRAPVHIYVPREGRGRSE
ncbi:hypothetical protein [Dietzia sp.]|uniref:hypothetical protein n=1 Tax=Dietzia sp. TaxID=1871616 RepID=UPI002FD8CFDC